MIKLFDSLKIPDRTLSNFELIEYAKQLNIAYFRGVFMDDTLPKKINKYESGIVNLDSNKGPGTYLVCLKKRNNTVEYFDSFGDLSQEKTLIKDFKSAGDVNICYNYNRYQKYNQTICGKLCLEFLCL